MRKLSERLEQADYDCSGLWEYLTDAGYPADGDALNKLKSIMQTILDCQRLARRVEAAPVREVIEQHTQGREWEALAFPLDGFLPPLMGKRVAILAVEGEEQ